VGGSPVEFDDEALLTPESVDPHAAHSDVHFGRCDARGFAQPQEALLENAQRLGKLRQVGVECVPKGSRAATALAEHRPDIPGLENLQVRHGDVDPRRLRIDQ